jgi:hypothetical protein
MTEKQNKKMNNPFDSSSTAPVNKDHTQQTAAGSNNFSIRTMQDDLEKLQRGEMFLKKEPAEVPPTKKPDFSSAQNPSVGHVFTPVQAFPPAPKPTSTPQENPFISKQELINPFPKQPAAPPTAKQKDIVEIPLSEKPVSNTRSYIIISLVALTIIVIGLGGYYFWTTTTHDQAPPLAVPAESKEAPVVVISPTEKYSQDKPNYLTLDIAKITPEEIKASTLEIATELKDKAALAPYEFIVVDANNNPVAFPIFATAAKLNLSPTLLENLGEDFSLFFYNDAGNIRLAVVAKVVEKNIVTFEMQNQETTFVADAGFLFLDSVPQIKSGTFGSGTHENISTRYLNLDPQSTLSIDYAITDTNLIIGTSKNTLRAVLDKLAGKAPTANNPVPTATTTSTEEIPIIPTETSPIDSLTTPPVVPAQ